MAFNLKKIEELYCWRYYLKFVKNVFESSIIFCPHVKLKVAFKLLNQRCYPFSHVKSHFIPILFIFSPRVFVRIWDGGGCVVLWHRVDSVAASDLSLTRLLHAKWRLARFLAASGEKNAFWDSQRPQIVFGDCCAFTLPPRTLTRWHTYTIPHEHFTHTPTNTHTSKGMHMQI